MAQQRAVQTWIRTHQPLETRRLEAQHAVLLHLTGEATDETGDLPAALTALYRLDEQAAAQLLPQLLDALVMQPAAVTDEMRRAVRSFVILLAGESQHAALLVCWYLRALMSPPTRPAPDSPKASRGHRRARSGGSSRDLPPGYAASADARAYHALQLIQQMEELLATAPPPETGSPSADTAATAAAAAASAERPLRPASPPLSPHDSMPPAPGYRKVRASAGEQSPQRAAASSDGGGGGGVRRLDHLRKSLAFAQQLSDLCASLLAHPKEARAAVLRAGLGGMPEGDVRGAWLPVAHSELRNHAVNGMLPQEAVAISTNKHCPAMLYLPVLQPEPTRTRTRTASREFLGFAATGSGGGGGGGGGGDDGGHARERESSRTDCA